MKYIKTMICLMLFFILCIGKAMAISPIQINREITSVPTATPTSIVVTKVTATPYPTVSVAQTKPTETEKITLAPSPVETVTPEPTIEEVEKTEKKAEKTDSNMWFWVVIAGLMALILAMQIWSTKKNEQNQSKKENE